MGVLSPGVHWAGPDGYMHSTGRGPAWAPFTTGVTKPVPRRYAVDGSVITTDEAGRRYTPNVGWTPGTVLTAWTGSNTISTTQTISGKRFTGEVKITSGHVTFIDCELVGPPSIASPSTAAWCVRTTNASAAATFTRCTIRPQIQGELVNCLAGYNLVTERCDIQGGIDGVEVQGGTLNSDGAGGYWSWQDTGSFIGWQSIYSPAPNNPFDPVWTHSDSFQLLDGRVRMRGTWCNGVADPLRYNVSATLTDGSPNPHYRPGGRQVNSACMIKNDSGNPVWVDIQYCWMGGGEASVNCANNVDGTDLLGNFGVIKNNVFAGDHAWLTEHGLPGLIMPGSSTCDTGDGTAEANRYADGTVLVPKRWSNT